VDATLVFGAVAVLNTVKILDSRSTLPKEGIAALSNKKTHLIAGVTVTFWKFEQSTRRELRLA
jgi:hypothetical protein